MSEGFTAEAYQQVVWVHTLLHSDTRVGIMDRAVLLALAVEGEIDVAEQRVVSPRSSEQLAALSAFAPGDVWVVCMEMAQRGWVSLVGEDGFVLSCVLPGVTSEAEEIARLEQEGISTSDAQAIVEAREVLTDDGHPPM